MEAGPTKKLRLTPTVLQAKTVIRPHPSVTVTAAWGNKGNSDGNFSSPSGVTVGINGHVYVADTDNHRIQCFTSSGLFVGKWGKLGTDNGEFNRPSSVAITVYNGLKDSIFTALHAIPELYAFPPGVLPICVAYVGKEHIIVADTGNHRLQTFEMDGGFVRAWGGNGTHPGQFDLPLGCATDTGGIIYVSDTGNHRIQAFQADGTFVRQWGSFGNEESQFNAPMGISVATGHREVSQDVVYVCEFMNNRIACYTTHGRFLRYVFSFLDRPRCIYADEGQRMCEAHTKSDHKGGQCMCEAHTKSDHKGGQRMCEAHTKSDHKGGQRMCEAHTKSDRKGGQHLYICSRSSGFEYFRPDGVLPYRFPQLDYAAAVSSASNGLLYIVDDINHRVVLLKMST